MLILPPALKPLNLIHLIHHSEFNVDRALVFTKSVESAARLVKLLEFFEDAYVLGGGGGKRLVIEQYSGEMRARDKKQLLAEFGEGKVNLLVWCFLLQKRCCWFFRWKNRMLRLDRERYWFTKRLTRCLLRYPAWHPEICASCRSNRSSRSTGHCVDVGREARGSSFQGHVAKCWPSEGCEEGQGKRGRSFSVQRKLWSELLKRHSQYEPANHCLDCYETVERLLSSRLK